MKRAVRNPGISLAIAMLYMAIAVTVAKAEPAQVYRQALQMAAAGHEPESVAALHAASAMLPEREIWKSRMLAAAVLIDMKQRRNPALSANDGRNANLALAASYIEKSPLAGQQQTSRPVAAVAALLPGAGHAWQGRWRDATTAALLVWPMLLLTLWAAKRRMGPVTLFFSLITVWLWSGTIYSSVSLAERGTAEAYFTWWQQVWQASGLPGRPW